MNLAWSPCPTLPSPLRHISLFLSLSNASTRKNRYITRAHRMEDKNPPRLLLRKTRHQHMSAHWGKKKVLSSLPHPPAGPPPWGGFFIPEPRDAPGLGTVQCGGVVVEKHETETPQNGGGSVCACRSKYTVLNLYFDKTEKGKRKNKKTKKQKKFARVFGYTETL